MKTPVLELAEVSEADTPAFEDINEAYRKLDAVVQLTVKDKDLTIPPTDPVQGDRYIVPAGATGVWSGKTNRIAYFRVDGWAFAVPRDGWIAWVQDEAIPYVFDQTDWENIFSASSAAALPDFSGGHAEAVLFELNFSQGGAHELTLQGDVVISVSGAVAGKVCRTHLILRQDSAGERAVVWPLGTFWPGGEPPALNRQAHNVHIFEISTYDGGVTLYARLLAGTLYNGVNLPAPYPSTDDAYWPYVTHLLHFNGVDGSSSFVDERGHAITLRGAPVLTTDEQKFGTASGDFVLQPNDDYYTGDFVNYLEFAEADDNDLTNGDFTIECWLKLKNLAAPIFFGSIIAIKGTEINENLGIFAAIGNSIRWSMTAFAVNITAFNPPFPGGQLNTDEFKHVCLERRGGVYFVSINGYMWTDGVNYHESVGGPPDLSAGPLSIGGGHIIGVGDVDNYFSADFWMDELRITRGRARYAPEPPETVDPLHYFYQFVPPTTEFSGPSAFAAKVQTRRRPLGAHWPSPADAQDISIRMAYPAKIRAVTILTTGGPGDCVVDIWKAPFNDYPPTDANTIVGTSAPSITTADTLHSEDLNGWDTDIEIGDVMTFHLQSFDVFDSITIVLDLEEKA